MANDHHYRLPLKADESPYTIREILAHTDEDYVRFYDNSYRLAMALTTLQKKVETAVEVSSARRLLLPSTPEQASELQEKAEESVEYAFDLADTRGMAFHEDVIEEWGGDPADLLKEAVNDPLRMARKHVVDLLYESTCSELGPIERMTETASGPHNIRTDIARDVQSITMLMADNAVRHYSQRVGRAA